MGKGKKIYKMEKCEPITTEPVNPPPYNSKQEYEEEAETHSTQKDTAIVVQQTTQDQTAITMVPQPMIAHATTHTSLCECDGPWWGLCCLNMWCFGFAGFEADRRLHGSATGIGWGLFIMGVGRWLFFALSICSLLYILGVINIPVGLYWAGFFVSTGYFILTIVLLHMQRRNFINHQLLSGSYPNNEDCCCMCCTVFWCSGPHVGQIASAMYKQSSRVVPIQV